MQSDDPSHLLIGTEVSAKFKGGWCEARIKRINKSVKCKVMLKESALGTINVDAAAITLPSASKLEAGQPVEVTHGKRQHKGVISSIKDCSTYTVVFNDGDEKVLKRSQICLKGGRHFDSAATLDTMPLYHPETLVSSILGKRTRRQRASSGCDEETAEASEDKSPNGISPKRRNSHSSPVANSPLPSTSTTTQLPLKKKSKKSSGMEMAGISSPLKGISSTRSATRALKHDSSGGATAACESAKSATTNSNSGQPQSATTPVRSEAESVKSATQRNERPTQTKGTDKKKKEENGGKDSGDAQTSRRQQVPNSSSETESRKEEAKSEAAQKPNEKPTDVVRLTRSQADTPSRLKSGDPERNSATTTKERKPPSEQAKPKAANERPLTEGMAVVIMEHKGSDKARAFGVIVSEEEFTAATTKQTATPQEGRSEDMPRGSMAIRNFQNGHYQCVKVERVRPFSTATPRPPESASSGLKVAYERAALYHKKRRLPSIWKRREFLPESTNREASTSALPHSSTTAATPSSTRHDQGVPETAEEKKEEEERINRFVALFYKFQDDSGNPMSRIPVLAGKEINLWRFYNSVQRLGGHKRVTAELKWRIVLEEINIDTTPQAAKVAYLRHFEKFEAFMKNLGYCTLSDSTLGAGGGTTGRGFRSLRTTIVADPSKKKVETERAKVEKVEKRKEEKPAQRKEEPLAIKPQKHSTKEGSSEASSQKSTKSSTREKAATEPISSRVDPSAMGKKPSEEIKPRESREAIKATSAESDLMGERGSKRRRPSIDSKRSEHTQERSQEKLLSTSGDGDYEADAKLVPENHSIHGSSHTQYADLSPSAHGQGQLRSQRDFGYTNANIFTRFYQGQKIHARHHLRFYDARVIEVRQPSLAKIVKGLTSAYELSKQLQGSADGTARPEVKEALRNFATATQCYVHYLGWNSRYDEWLYLHKMRVDEKDARESRREVEEMIPSLLSRGLFDAALEWCTSAEGIPSLARIHSSSDDQQRPRRLSASQGKGLLSTSSAAIELPAFGEEEVHASEGGERREEGVALTDGTTPTRGPSRPFTSSRFSASVSRGETSAQSDSTTAHQQASSSPVAATHTITGVYSAPPVPQQGISNSGGSLKSPSGEPSRRAHGLDQHTLSRHQDVPLVQPYSVVVTPSQRHTDDSSGSKLALRESNSLSTVASNVLPAVVNKIDLNRGSPLKLECKKQQAEECSIVVPYRPKWVVAFASAGQQLTQLSSLASTELISCKNAKEGETPSEKGYSSSDIDEEAEHTATHAHEESSHAVRQRVLHRMEAQNLFASYSFVGLSELERYSLDSDELLSTTNGDDEKLKLFEVRMQELRDIYQKYRGKLSRLERCRKSEVQRKRKTESKDAPSVGSKIPRFGHKQHGSPHGDNAAESKAEMLEAMEL